MASVLTLIVPGCCGPLPMNNVSPDQLDPEVQNLSLWKALSRADRKSGVDGIYQQLASVFDFNHSDPLPYAALNLLGEDGSPGNEFCLHADPVNMQADIDHAILFDAQSLQLNDSEVDTLIAELNAHFSDDGIILKRGSVANWYIQQDVYNNISTSALHDVVGRNVNQFMPTGKDQQYWRRFMNEAQMLLHTSEINREREARGQLPVNSLWLWGEGRLPEQPVTQPKFDHVLTDNTFVRGLAKQGRVSCEALPEDLAILIETLNRTGHVCLMFDDLLGSIHYADHESWQNKLVELFNARLQPLIEYAVENRLKIDFYPCNGYQYTMRFRQRFRFWRRINIKNHLRLDA